MSGDAQVAEGSNGGYVKLYRKLLDSGVFEDPHSLQVWIYLLLAANWKDVMRLDGQVVKRGSLRFAVKKEAARFNLSHKQLRRIIDQFAACSMIDTKGASKYTLISITNYETYQSTEEAEGQPKGNEGATKGQAEGNSLKNGRRKEGKNEEGISKEIPTGFGPLFKCRDVNPAYLTEFEYGTIKATVGANTDAHLLHWSAQSAKPKYPWRCARRNLAENLIVKWRESQGGTQPPARNSHVKRRVTSEELFAAADAAETEAERERREGKI